MKKILFLGDSITDTGRNTEAGSMESIGQGYVVMISGALGVRYPGQYETINRGISGNRIVDLYARIKSDCWNLSPDVISILIGVNDVWHELSNYNGVDARRYEEMYHTIIEETKRVLKTAKFLIMEPFVLEGTATINQWEVFHSEVSKRAAAARRIAQTFDCTFLPLQERFNEALAKAPADYWLKDGVHPTPAGHGLIAREWQKAYLKAL